MKKSAQKRLDSFFNVKIKRPQYFYIDWNIKDISNQPIAQWMYEKPKKITWKKIIRWKEIGDMLICCNDLYNDQSEDKNINNLLNIINAQKKDKSFDLISFFKSHLQMAIRRHMPRQALQSAIELLKLSKSDFIKKISNIMLEDIRLKTYFPTLSWLISSISLEYNINEYILKLLLSYVLDLCNDTHYDTIIYDPFGKDRQYSSDMLDKAEKSNLPLTEKNLLYSLLFRLDIGGIDMENNLIIGYTANYLKAFEKGENINNDDLKVIDKVEDIPLNINEYIPEAVNFNSNYMLVKNIINELEIKEYTENEIKECIYEYNTKYNARKNNSINVDNKEKLEKIWNIIKEILFKMQCEYINKIINKLK